MTNDSTQLGRNRDATGVRHPLGMTSTSAARSTKIRRRVGCTIVATTLAVVVGVSAAPTASAEDIGTTPATSAAGHSVPTPPIRMWPCCMSML
jgi:hypothetical protein